ncbi:RNA-metabolising metallo-beta-lactamase [Fictibacillus macauensis ZFHKF-1]|uniref:RNA-metabolising metallo-beta-lactamase n=1 Tax=Fictibacillus macauensis ZFHKF-1 TaxID=1196324 RepID=I8AJU7_9BACL|nr:MBL fold metallo-hydrolase [Fictibacillus macauensis]EIT86067.1 RNA-metabolising metallo-beta-lactamase [Fictibacillus macauensis ZFHKF-1]
MKITVLGGGNEIGASCLHIQLADQVIVIDAGMRMHGDQLLPSLGLIEELGVPDVILVTHAHADHIGALPVLHAMFPHVPMYATPPTIELTTVMMKDSFKIMSMRSEQTHTLPPYTKEQVAAVLQAFLPFPANQTLHIGHVKITSYRAGHILGAVMFLIEGDGEKLFVTGDLSFKAGRTIPGAVVPKHIEPDVVIMESTYGNRAHSDRNSEEKRLAEHVAATIAGGGFALIPAFALGRAQEVLLILQDYMERGLIPQFPIYVDGLVTPISRIYRDYPHYLKGPVAHRIMKNGDAFLTERCRAVSRDEREDVLNGKPACIVASSGMLTGGASAWYAERLLSNEKNAIFITGYQDEESPGRKLLNLADGIEQHIELNGREYPVQCSVTKYGLSGHADAHEMNVFIEALAPTHTLLVHGDDTARMQLAERLHERYSPILVENGETYEFEKRTSGKGIKGKRYSLDPMIEHARSYIGQLLLYRQDEDDLYKLALCTSIHPKGQLLFCQTLKGKPLKLQPHDVACAIAPYNDTMSRLVQEVEPVLTFARPMLQAIDWTRLTPGRATLTDIYQALQVTRLEQQVAVALALQLTTYSHSYYTMDEKFISGMQELKLPVQGLQMNATKAMEWVRTQFQEIEGFLKCGVDFMHTANEQLTLYFDFPNRFTAQERSDLTGLVVSQTGWRTVLSDSIRQDRLTPLLGEALGESVGSLSIHLATHTVVVNVEQPPQAEQALASFTKRTGFTVQFKDDKAPSTASQQPLYSIASNTSPLENNQAMEEAKRWAHDRQLTIYKTSLRQQGKERTLEVHFITPEIAERHHADLEELSYRIGFPVTFAQQPKQNEVIQRTLTLLPNTWQLKKNPSIHIDRKTVGVKLETSPAPKEVDTVREALYDQTGYQLQLL